MKRVAITVGLALLSAVLLVGCESSDHGHCEAIGDAQALCDNNSNDPNDFTVEDYDDVDVD